MNKKGFDGMYIVMGLFIGLIMGAGLVFYLVSNGTLAGICPAPPVLP